MAKMNWRRVETETRDRHAIRQGYGSSENPNRRPEVDDGRTKPTVTELRRRITELERQLAKLQASRRTCPSAKMSGLTQESSLSPTTKTEKLRAIGRSESKTGTAPSHKSTATELERRQTSRRSYLSAKIGGLTQERSVSPKRKKLSLKRRGGWYSKMKNGVRTYVSC